MGDVKLTQVVPVFNKDNTEWEDGSGSLVLGQHPALLDSINRKHPALFKFYKGQKSVDWSEDEVNLQQSRTDFENCPEEIYEQMITNLAFQWELDSVASNTMVPLLAPFITDSDFRLAIGKFGEIEALHALTYSEIVRLAVPKPKDVFNKVLKNSAIMERSDTVVKQLNNMKEVGLKYSLGLVENDKDTYKAAFLGMFTFYCLERLQFMSSFARTFMVVELGYFQGVGKLVQKIMQDEFYYHAQAMRYVIKTEMFTKRGMVCWMDNKEELQAILDDVLQREYDWNEYTDSNLVSKDVMDKWVQYNAQDIYELMMLDMPFSKVDKQPLPFMDDWLDIDAFQNANQEGDANNYSLNSFRDDIPQGKIYGYY